ncbi:MAG: RNase adapter RapZ [Bacillota bacterium]|nr:MAG: RNase adapter RapZ [Bacillota bacterium]
MQKGERADPSKGRFIIITGLSGAGKTHAKRVLEDMGYFCVDNLPPVLIPSFAELCGKSEGRVNRIALVVDIRGGEFFGELNQALDKLDDMGFIHQVLFLEADDDTLVRRFKEARLRHPLAAETSVEEAIRAERRRLEDIRGRANLIVDTSRLTPAQFREKLLQIFAGDRGISQFTVTFVSFGFKHGLPADADLVFDVRFLPNPQYVDTLRPHDGRGREVADYVLRSPLTQSYLRRLLSFLEFLLPHFVNEGKTQLIVAIGCTGGRHRSVAVVDRLAAVLRSRGHSVLVDHRNIDAGP